MTLSRNLFLDEFQSLKEIDYQSITLMGNNGNNEIV